jgi:glutamate dehydrogenase/leucine dehydrogenase
MAGVLRQMEAGGYELVVHGYDRTTGLRAIIAVHETTLGPSLGGIRMRVYPSEEDALIDVLRLAEAMTYKAALAGLNLGGGKAVVLGDVPAGQRAARFQALGRMIERLGGAYIATEDMGTATADLVHVRAATRHAVGLPESAGGGGDPSPTTAWGVLHGMRAALAAVGESESLAGRRVAVQGVGKVGLALVGFLRDAGAEVLVADPDVQRVTRAVEQHGARAVDLEGILFQSVDVLAPCAAGAILSEQTIPRLQCRIVAGGANNQLATDADGDRLRARGILYAPDFAVNAGGLIHVADELDPRGHSVARARAKTEEIHETLSRIFAESRATAVAPAKIALRLARQRLAPPPLDGARAVPS